MVGGQDDDAHADMFEFDGATGGNIVGIIA